VPIVNAELVAQMAQGLKYLARGMWNMVGELSG
jgi:hypothetical protein